MSEYTVAGLYKKSERRRAVRDRELALERSSTSSRLCHKDQG